MDLSDLLERARSRVEDSVAGNAPDEAAAWADVAAKLVALEQLTADRQETPAKGPWAAHADVPLKDVHFSSTGLAARYHCLEQLVVALGYTLCFREWERGGVRRFEVELKERKTD